MKEKRGRISEQTILEILGVEEILPHKMGACLNFSECGFHSGKDPKNGSPYSFHILQMEAETFREI